ncbi:SPOR domain-containing protein [Paucihalobacter sp.]|uniref:SPOR domain-containing protein n=1 Tax=Paucihalobacter sp. TaxID=2850405 RepID=UPI002FE13C0A
MKKLKFKITLFLALLFGFGGLGYAQNGTVTIDQDRQIEKLLEFKKDLTTNEIYKIQVFSGNRSSAEQAKTDFMNNYNDWPVSMEYNTPNYKIWIGNFTNRLEAERALQKIKSNYQTAFIFKPKTSNKS